MNGKQEMIEKLEEKKTCLTDFERRKRREETED